MNFKIKHIKGDLSETTQEELERRKDRVVEVKDAWDFYHQTKDNVQEMLRKEGFQIVMFGIIDRSPEFYGDRYYIYHDSIELKSRECYKRINALHEAKNKRWDEEVALKLIDAGFRKNALGDWIPCNSK